jgi:hypothetical protein
VNKIRHLISILFGVLALVVLALGLAWLVGPRGALPAQQVSSVQTPTPGPTGMPTPTSTRYVEPTAPSEDWPTLTSPPTRGIPTPRGTLAVKASPTPVPVLTRPPLALTPVPEGTPPDDLSSLYYVADAETGSELRMIGMDAQGRRWGESKLIIERFPGNLVGLHLSPDGRYLALEFLGDGYGEVSIVERSSGRVWCPLTETPTGCQGGFSGWTPENHFLFRPFDVPPEGVVPMGVAVVNPETGQYTPLGLPVEPEWGYSLARNVSLGPDGSGLAYSITYPEDNEKVSEVWVMHMDSGEEHLLRKIKGLVNALSWSPTGEQLLYVYQSELSQFKPSELWLMNVDGSDARLLADDLAESGELGFRPVWSPDGRQVAFVQLDQPITFDGTYVILAWSNVYVVDTITEQITRLSTFEKRETNYPTWSPDGRFVAFVSTGRLGEETLYSEVWVTSVDDNQLYSVSGTAKSYNALIWLPPALLTEGR